MDPIKDAFAKAKQDISELRVLIDELKKEIEEIKRMLPVPTQTTYNPSFNTENPTIQQSVFPKMPLYAPTSSDTKSSIGNKGVPTNRQSNQQTDNQPSFEEVIGSVDSLKERIKTQFLNLTRQEMEVFSTIYLLDDQSLKVDYPLVASHLNLSESSIRDYVHKMIRKGIPILKHLEKNKKVYLSIDTNLKRVAPLSAISIIHTPNISD
jgi:hypothetical protein